MTVLETTHSLVSNLVLKPTHSSYLQFLRELGRNVVKEVQPLLSMEKKEGGENKMPGQGWESLKKPEQREAGSLA